MYALKRILSLEEREPKLRSKLHRTTQPYSTVSDCTCHHRIPPAKPEFERCARYVNLWAKWQTYPGHRQRAGMPNPQRPFTRTCTARINRLRVYPSPPAGTKLPVPSDRSVQWGLTYVRSSFSAMATSPPPFAVGAGALSGVKNEQLAAGPLLRLYHGRPAVLRDRS